MTSTLFQTLTLIDFLHNMNTTTSPNPMRTGLQHSHRIISSLQASTRFNLSTPSAQLRRRPHKLNMFNGSTAIPSSTRLDVIRTGHADKDCRVEQLVFVQNGRFNNGFQDNRRRRSFAHCNDILLMSVHPCNL
jgi:hypothetical protein